MKQIDWGWLNNGWALAVALASIVLGLAKLGDAYRICSKYVRQRIDHMFGNAALKKNLEDLSQSMGVIMRELLPNGGRSMRDVVNRIEESNIAQDLRMKALFSNHSDATVEFDWEGKLIWANRTYMRLVGRDLGDLAGYGWLNSIYYEDRERVKGEWDEAIDQGRDWETSFRRVRSDGDVIKVAIKATAMRNPAGKVVGFMATVVADKPPTQQ
jgi:PAS domain S-box-containing protein